MRKRYEELDSLRGIAALIVIFYHLRLVILHETLVNSPINKFIEVSPLRILFMGRESVIFFFLLSGFVLSIPFHLGMAPSFGTFLFKRVCRIYIPYLAGIVLAILARQALFTPGGIDGYSSWFNTQWSVDPTASLIVNHIFLIGDYNAFAYNAAIWSLIHEMRVSIIFPLLMIPVTKWKWPASLLLGLALAAVGFAIHLSARLQGILHLQEGPFNQPLQKTLPYILVFIAGAILAKYKEDLIDRFKASAGRVALFAAALFLYAYSPLIGAKLSAPGQVLADWGVTLGAAVILIAALGSARLAKFLLMPSVHYLGKISYSVYLLHLPVIMSLFYLLHNALPLWVLMIISLPVVILVAGLSYRFLEEPSIRAGRLLKTVKNS